ncbi:MAG: hypothetical protein ACOY7U_02195 [Acidobacteriota bacterium]
MLEKLSVRNGVKVLAAAFLLAFTLSEVSAQVRPKTSPVRNRSCKTLTWEQVLELGERASDDDRTCLLEFVRTANRNTWEAKLAQVLLEEWDALFSPALTTPRLLDKIRVPRTSLKVGWVYFYVTVDERGNPVSGCIDGDFTPEEGAKYLAALLSSRYRPARDGRKFVRGTLTIVEMGCR